MQNDNDLFFSLRSMPIQISCLWAQAKKHIHKPQIGFYVIQIVQGLLYIYKYKKFNPSTQLILYILY
jgi:hypothetical protein